MPGAADDRTWNDGQPARTVDGGGEQFWVDGHPIEQIAATGPGGGANPAKGGGGGRGGIKGGGASFGPDLTCSWGQINVFGGN